MVAVLVQRRRRNRATARGRRRRIGARGAAVAQRGGQPSARGRRLGGGHGCRRILVHSTCLLSWRDLMRRGIVLGTMLAVGGLAAGKAQPPAAGAPKGVEGE